MSSTELLYYLDPATSGLATVVSVGQDAGRDFVILDRTLFHPGGGGQKTDVGTINGVPMVKAEKRGAEVFHFLGGALSAEVGAQVAMEVDPATRLLHAQWHSAGHVLGSVLEEVLGATAVSGQHWPGDAFMRFAHASELTEAEIVRAVEVLTTVIREDRPVTAVMQGEMRLVTVPGYAAVPCGGTHVAGTGAIGAIEIVSARVKKEHLMVIYRVVSGASA